MTIRYGIREWKFSSFSITQILREINFEDSRIAKSAILRHLETLNLVFMNFALFEDKKYQIKGPKVAKRHFQNF